MAYSRWLLLSIVMSLLTILTIPSAEAGPAEGTVISSEVKGKGKYALRFLLGSTIGIDNNVLKFTGATEGQILHPLDDKALLYSSGRVQEGRQNKVVVAFMGKQQKFNIVNTTKVCIKGQKATVDDIERLKTATIVSIPGKFIAQAISDGFLRYAGSSEPIYPRCR